MWGRCNGIKRGQRGGTQPTKKKKHEGIIIKMIHDDKCILNSSGGEEGEARTRMYAKTCRHENSTFQENIFSWRIKNTYVKCRR